MAINLKRVATDYISLESATNCDLTGESFLKSFNLNVYKILLDKLGLNKTWDLILNTISNNSIDQINQSFLKYDELGELYEIGLSLTNGISKKELGKYYTPKDVAEVMADMLLEENIENIVDVAAGTGNLIIEVLKKLITKNYNVVEFIKQKRLWLYDIDYLALKICVAKIELLFNEKLKDYINIIVGDFLNKDITLPKNSSVITNPPYSVIKEFKKEWEVTEVLKQSKDLYAGFMDKIISSSNNAVFVTPQSYLVSDKFSKLRIKLASNYYGEIFAFDNVPGTLFNGKKHGIFNTNNCNGVRAAISSIKKNGHNGFKLSHLIRFKTDQRSEVLNLKFLRSKLGTKLQDLNIPIKSFRELEPFVENILNKPHTYISQLLELNAEKQEEKFKINISSSARYYTVGSKRKLDRRGCYEIHAKDEHSFYLLYALLNSSYVYMWWRFFDGGILFSKRNFLRIPIDNILLNEDSLNSIKKHLNNMIEHEDKYLSYKKNAGKNQETIKFPIEFRTFINKTLFSEYAEYFELLHNNFEVKNGE